eukprot:COSAG01_NODE_50621_length_361_cov_28.767176_1_plen_29_part_10
MAMAHRRCIHHQWRDLDRQQHKHGHCHRH